MPVMHIDTIELAPLCHHLALCFRSQPLRGYRSGKTRIRNMVIRMLGCQTAAAQRLVDGLETAGHIRFDKRRSTPRQKPSQWRFSPVWQSDDHPERRLTG